ncbi:MAG TPA: hypothetical protein VFU02_21050 [Polyangiaceae bacterium]|nr:hypothetical protein [Polyangiaceae bacterium]
MCDGDEGCSAHGDRSACEAEGCEWLTPCMPVVNCDSFGASAACEAQAGCEWDADAEACSTRLSDGCVDVVSETDCALVVGCVWADENFVCSGTATACDELDESACALQEGCAEL